MERERGGGDDEVEHEVDGEEVREEARRDDVAEDLGQIDFSTHGYVMTSKGRLLGFPNHPYFLKFMKMARCGVPLK